MKEVQIKLPEYISIAKYEELQKIPDTDRLEKMVQTIELLTEYTRPEIRKWSVKAIAEIATKLADVAAMPNEFIPIVMIGEQAYGYAGLSKSSFGEYLDLESYLKDPNNSLADIAAILYRPIKKHKFKSFSFTRKYGLKAVNNKIDNPFKWYTVEEYDNELREERSEMMKDFPVQLILGAMGFTSAIGSLYLNDTLYLTPENQTMKKKQENQILDLLSQATGGGLVLCSV